MLILKNLDAICLSNHKLSIYGSKALVDLRPLFSFLIYTQ
jgi:hypothetical protein